MSLAYDENTVLTPDQVKALELYEEGSTKESTGLMSDAIFCYSRALRLYDNVERLYRKKLNYEYQKELASREPIVTTTAKLKNLNLNNNDGEENEQNTKEDEEEFVTQLDPCWLLEILSDDILVEIISILILKDPFAHISLSHTCKKLSQLSFNSSAYKQLCKIIYPKQVYSESALELNDITKNQDRMVKNWDFNWELMLNDRPFIKYHGLYISKVTYISEGARESSFYAPVKLVTYFRYLRFYPDGTVFKLTTTDEPNQIVPQFSRENQPHLKNSFISRFQLEMDGQILIKRESEDYNFLEELEIVSLGYRKFHRLNWISSSYINEDGEKGYFTLKKEKPFNFSGVKAYHKI
ncbi:hypothetical protein WICMUC_000266 [Wickerhamomyces mucosus]|uniref:F-box protein Hrt3/FBXO9 C-terminal domain-containing protein n=1 Tax=Wickerhamomyces mucosus TaxID=1378264 RepID=A0A9P8PZR7_9ASCO|nr:hypothetical protein WICMUC_000266 [Wickerhamomyces mucosus]